MTSEIHNQCKTRRPCCRCWSGSTRTRSASRRFSLQMTWSVLQSAGAGTFAPSSTTTCRVPVSCRGPPRASRRSTWKTILSGPIPRIRPNGCSPKLGRCGVARRPGRAASPVVPERSGVARHHRTTQTGCRARGAGTDTVGSAQRAARAAPPHPTPPRHRVISGTGTPRRRRPGPLSVVSRCYNILAPEKRCGEPLRALREPAPAS